MSRPDRSRPGATAPHGTDVPVDLDTSPHTTRRVVSLLAGPVIWSVHFLVVYLVVESGCTGSGPGLARFDPPVPDVVTLVATAFAALACLATAGWSLRRWRAASGGEVVHPLSGLDFVGFLLSSLGVVTVLFVGLPALWLPACVP